MSSRQHTSKSRRSHEDHDKLRATEDLPPRELEPSVDLIGAVIDVPDAHWDIETTTSTQHPGACTHYQQDRRRGILLKGTDNENVLPDLRWRYYFVMADDENKLEFETAFECVPRYFRLHRLRLLLADRLRGRLSAADLAALCQRLNQLYGI